MKQFILSVGMFLTAGSMFGQTNLSATDAIIQGSLGVGFDVAMGETFPGNATLLFKENNLRIRFDDTSSSGSFSANDWEIAINDIQNGGSDYFAVGDLTAGTVPFKVMGAAPNDALYVSPNGRVGFGTPNPLKNLHAVSGDTPTLRFEQDNSDGWGAYTWDIAGNEANFFVRNVATAKLPFRIFSNAHDNVLNVRNSSVGIGTINPNIHTSLHLGGGTKGLMLNSLAVADATTFAGSIGTTEEGMMIYQSTAKTIQLWDGTQWKSLLTTEVDGDATNEIQDISLAGSSLTISSGSTIDLSSINTNTQLTEVQVDAFVANNGYLTSFTEVDGDITNELQNLTAATLTGTTLEIGIENGSSVNVDLAKIRSIHCKRN